MLVNSKVLMWFDGSAAEVPVYHDFEGEVTYAIVAKSTDIAQPT